jgi:DNA polymerase-3 subunit alpha
MASSYIPLHVHSHYSLLNAIPQIPALVKRAKSYGMTSLALTDDANMYGAIEFYKECKKHDIKPILGLDCYVAQRTRNDKEAGIDNKRYRLVLLAENNEGYFNLINLVTEANLSGFYYKPRIDRELMSLHSSGIIAIVPSFSSEIVEKLKIDDREGAKESADFLKEVYGKNNVFIEVSSHPEILGHEEITKKLSQFAYENDILTIAGQEVYYLDPEHRTLRDVVRSIAGNTSRSFDMEEENFSFLSTEEMQYRFSSHNELLQRTHEIAERCNVNLTLGSWSFPELEIPKDSTFQSELRKVVLSGLQRRGVEPRKEVMERIEYELRVIHDKGFDPYFLIVQDLLRHAKENGIPTTIRGSVAGSLVTYLAGITNLNPLDYDLKFERFLNPERPSAPDIDMDYADNRRDEILEYARKKYGEDKVAQIGTFGTMLARGAVRDVCRALGYPYALGDEVAKLIPPPKQGFPMTIERALKEVPELKALYDSRSDISEILRTAQGIEGNARHIGVHAAGVVMAPTKLTDFCPVQIDPKGGKKITQYDMHSVEDAGLIKFDFLGLSNLAIIADAIKRVKWHEKTDVSLEEIPINDSKTFSMLSAGFTHGTFQLNGAAMTAYLKELRPSTIHDINAMVALYRPGPMAFIPEYIERKHDPSKIVYLDPRFESILSRSYGVITYQDDVLAIAINFAGYSWLEADKFRKAMGKKIPEEMAAQKEKFMKGCKEIGKIEDSAIQELWRQIETFAAYGFNKAHAASYGRVAYQTSYLKANYPIEYMAAVLTSDAGDSDKIAASIHECDRMKIKILPPDINSSFGTFTVVKEENAIRFGLYSIKNVGESVADAIIESRKKQGVFTSLEDFIERIPPKFVNRKSMESLCKSGALDSFGKRAAILACLEDILKFSRELANKPKDQGDLFGLLQTSQPSSQLISSLIQTSNATVSDTIKLSWERELLGIYLTGHPLHAFREKLEGREVTLESIRTLKDGTPVTAVGVIDEIKMIVTKKGSKMAFLTVQDLYSSMECVIFPDLYEKIGSSLRRDSVFAFQGKLSFKRGDEPSLIVEKAKEIG